MRASRVPSLTRQYGIQPDTSNSAVDVADGVLDAVCAPATEGTIVASTRRLKIDNGLMVFTIPHEIPKLNWTAHVRLFMVHATSSRYPDRYLTGYTYMTFI
jgi:hypothetical protein